MLQECLAVRANTLQEQELTSDMIETEFVSGLWIKNQLVELNGTLAKLLGMRGRYSDMGMYVTSDNYIVAASSYTTTDYEVEQTLALKKYLDENNINMLYVNKPKKYMDDSLFQINSEWKHIVTEIWTCSYRESERMESQ